MSVFAKPKFFVFFIFISISIILNACSGDGVFRAIQTKEDRTDGNSTDEASTYMNGDGSPSDGSFVENISAGLFHTCAVKADKTTFCWGNGSNNQLGNNDAGDAPTPVQVLGVGGTGFLTGVKQVSAGSYHTCALKTDETVFCWGEGTDGKLGNNDTEHAPTPVQVLMVGTPGILKDVKQISAGDAHSCAVTKGGSVFCWGKGVHGQLGNNDTTQNFHTPVQVRGLGGTEFLSGIKQVSTGNEHTCALKKNGRVFCWGDGWYGRLGNHDVQNSPTPVQVAGVGGTNFLSRVTQISVGTHHTCAVNEDGRTFCWGKGSEDQLGDNKTKTYSSAPVQVVGVKGTGFLIGVKQVSAGNYHTCAVKTDETIFCWGEGRSGQLGNNDTTQGSPTPVQVLGVGGTGFLSGIKQVSAKNYRTCALKVGGAAFCWGSGNNGELGNNGIFHPTPMAVVGFP